MRRLVTKADRLECRAAYIPAGAVKLVPKGIAAEFYLYEVDGRPCAMCFIGTAARPAWRYSFRKPEDRERRIAEQIDSAAKHAAYSAAAQKERAAPSKINIGHIFVTCWGYDQTNREFYKVIETRGTRTIIVREVGQIRNETGWHRGNTVPGEQLVGEPITVRVTYGSRVKIDGHHASLWDGRPVDWSADH
jgi:hypothetical protein